MTGWITDTPGSTRFPLYTRSNASDVMPDPVSPLGATLSIVAVMEGFRDGQVRNGAFEMSELTAEGINPTCGFFNGFFYVNASVVRVMGERSGAGAAGIDAAFFGNRPDTPPYVAHPDDQSEAAAARLAERVGWVLSATEYPELDEHKAIADRARADRPDLSTLSDIELVARAREMTPLVRIMFDDHAITSSNSAIGPTILGQLVPDLMLRLISGAGDVDSAAPSHSNITISVVTMLTPAALRRARQAVSLSIVREAVASDTTKTSYPSSTRLAAVWTTQICASIPVRIACGRPSALKAAEKPASSIQEKCILGSTRLSPAAFRISAMVWPRPRGYCSVSSAGTPGISAACNKRRVFFMVRAGACIAGTKGVRGVEHGLAVVLREHHCGCKFKVSSVVVIESFAVALGVMVRDKGNGLVAGGKVPKPDC